MLYSLVLPLQEGRHAIPLDLSFDETSPGMNILTSEGFATALFHCATLKPGACATLAPVCSTFVAVCPSFVLASFWNEMNLEDYMAYGLSEDPEKYKVKPSDTVTFIPQGVVDLPKERGGTRKGGKTAGRCMREM